jgi:hypothetical protein
MFEAIVTVVVPDTGRSATKEEQVAGYDVVIVEPAHTRVFRYKFQNESDLTCALAHMTEDSVNDEQLTAK